MLVAGPLPVASPSVLAQNFQHHLPLVCSIVVTAWLAFSIARAPCPDEVHRVVAAALNTIHLTLRLRKRVRQVHAMFSLSIILWQVALGKFEGGDLSQGFMRMGDKAELLSRSALEQSSGLALSFEAPLKVPSLLICLGLLIPAGLFVSLSANSHAKLCYLLWRPLEFLSAPSARLPV